MLLILFIYIHHMAKWGSTCNHNYLYRWLPCQYFTLLMTGAWRPKHVEKARSNKICILLHHVGVLFNRNFNEAPHYAISSNPLSVHPPQTQVSSSAIRSWTRSPYVRSLMWQIKLMQMHRYRNIGSVLRTNTLRATQFPVPLSKLHISFLLLLQ